jgi:multidrug efflux system membrane fusion protein
VQTGDRGPYVFVIKPDKTADQRMVTVERINGAETIIQNGLKAGETVVTDGALRLVPGSRTTVKTDNAGPKAES